LRAKSAVCVWVLQHVLFPEEQAIIPLACCLDPGACLLVVNKKARYVPAKDSEDNDKEIWCSDAVSVPELLLKYFDLIDEVPMPENLATDAFVSLYMKR